MLAADPPNVKAVPEGIAALNDAIAPAHCDEVLTLPPVEYVFVAVANLSNA